MESYFEMSRYGRADHPSGHPVKELGKQGNLSLI
jgi:hypothetical protein